MTVILAKICSDKLAHIQQCKAKVSEQMLLDRALAASLPRGFMQALQRKADAGGFGLIAEIKKASPSKGVIRADFHPAKLAKAYEEGGAACISVLTDIPYFQGNDEYLAEARMAVTLPVLRKDFMLDPYQVLEARALGADCILLIMAALSAGQAMELEAVAQRLGMDVLVEVHDEQELDIALSILKSKLIGINNRNLKTLAVDLSVSLSLAARLPARTLAVCESGISEYRDLERMREAGISCFLVGESLMRQPDVRLATKELLGL